MDDSGYCFLLSAHASPLMLLYSFSSRNMSNSSAASFSLSLRSPAVSGLNVLFMFSWSSSLETALSPFYLIFLGPDSMRSASLHGALMRRSGSCSLAFGSLLGGPFRIQLMLTVSGFLGGVYPHWGFTFLL